ncbi:MAG: LysR family transcriptional regulator [Candidatus Coproplasma sp.]
MTLNQIKYIITIAERGAFSRAAEQLYISQPSLTEAVKDAESELGFALFNRGNKGVTPTAEGAEFIKYARQAYAQFEALEEKFVGGKNYKKAFCVSTQHYSFAVKAFVEAVKALDSSNFEFALRECKTRDIISDVASLRSEIGVLYISDFNRAAIQKLLNQNELVFKPIINCKAYAYLWKGHPLSKERSVTFAQLQNFPCLSFEQGDGASFYYAEEIISTRVFPRVIHACDRATMLNLMVGLNGFTVCSGIICEELNGDDFIAVPLDKNDPEFAQEMQIGYIVRKNSALTEICLSYIAEMKKYLGVK